MLGLCFSMHGCFSFKKLFLAFIYLLPCLALTSKNIPNIFKEVLKINEKLST